MELKQYLTVIGICFLCFLGIPVKITTFENENEEAAFKEYIKKFNKSYNENNAEYLTRFENFKNSLKLIEELNKNRTSNHSAFYGLTVFSDLSQDEFFKKRLQKASNQFKSSTLREEKRTKRSVIVPPKVDWREKGVIGGVHNQKTCGACWAFSAVETAESMNALKVGSLVELSVQEIIDCAKFGNYGCEGGDSCSLLNWLVATKTKITTEKLYPFIYKTGFCKTKKTKTGVQIRNYSCENFIGSENLLLKKLATHGPVAAAVNAINWQNYLGGVIQYHCSGEPQDLNHAIQIVGYDKTAPVPYYIGRNSWGTEFGDKGYVYIAIGGNLCGLANEFTQSYQSLTDCVPNPVEC